MTHDTRGQRGLNLPWGIALYDSEGHEVEREYFATEREALAYKDRRMREPGITNWRAATALWESDLRGTSFQEGPE